jgi:hypothetical protein
MNTRSTTKPWLITPSLALGLGFALLLPSFASAQRSKILHPSPIPSMRTSQNLDPRPMGVPSAPPQVADLYYVSKGGAGSDGLSWTTAFTQVQDALTIAISGDEIWVTSGVYTPGASISDSFSLVPGVEIYDGFSGAPGAEGDFEVRD